MVLILGEIIFKGNFKDRRREIQKHFQFILRNVDTEKLNIMSRKQKFISYNRIKIDLTKLVYKYNIRGLIQYGLTHDV
jgi:hypothetical protein